MSYAHILVPVDYAGCAAVVVAHAAKLADAFAARVTLLHVVNPPAGAHNADPSGAGTIAQALDGEAERELQALRQLFTAGRDVRIEIRHGSAVETILGCAREHHADILVMGTHARTGLRRMLMGSVAEQVLRRSPVPVFVVRAPDGVMDEPPPAWSQARAETEG